MCTKGKDSAGRDKIVQQVSAQNAGKLSGTAERGKGTYNPHTSARRRKLKRRQEFRYLLEDEWNNASSALHCITTRSRKSRCMLDSRLAYDAEAHAPTAPTYAGRPSSLL